MLPLVDTHCHLDFHNFDSDRSEVIKRARQAGVTQMIVPAVDILSSRQVVDLANCEADIFAAVGVHPNDLKDWQPTDLAVLRELAVSSKVVAIGEIGLDYYRNHASKMQQQEVMRQQLHLAGSLCLPVIVHIRNASPQDRQATIDAFEMLFHWQAGLSDEHSKLAARPGVLHSFSDNIGSAQQAIEKNFFIGISGPVTYRNADELRRVVEALPLEKLVIETDAPFLTPHPHRGERNEPANVKLVAQRIAIVREIEPTTVALQTTENAAFLFFGK